MKKFLVLILSGFMVVPAFSQTKLSPEQPIPLDPKVRQGKLSNGMTYYIRYNVKPEKRAELRLAVNAGSNMENDDQQGLAHFTEHMGFNGTKNFKKNDLINYLESVGTKFGPHLNAYTSFDETVYMIQIPTDKEDILNKGFDILFDWSCNFSMDTTEINKERGVVTEEWRMGLGANERMRKKYYPVLYKDSRYAVRLPIGKQDILQNCSHQTLIDFYKDWYRPDLMAVIAVGDFDVDKMEALIKEKFSKVPAKENPRQLVSWPVPDQARPAAVVVSDKENPNTTVQICYKQKKQFHPVLISDYPKNLAISLFESMLNKRIDELTKKADAAFNYGYGYYGSMVRTKDAYINYAITSEKNIEKTVETFASENERIKQFGFTATEFERTKNELLRWTEQDYNERDKSESRSLVSQYVYHFLRQEPAPGIEMEYELTKQNLSKVTLEQVNALAKEWISDGENLVVIVTGVDKEGVTLPSEKSLLDIISGVKKEKLTAYEDKVNNQPLMADKPKPGKVLSETINKDLSITEWKLSNGARVIFKPTDFKNDQVLFSARSDGGNSLVENTDYMSAAYATGVISEGGVGAFDNIQLKKYMSGKIASVYPYISSLNEGLRGNCSPQDMETMFQLINLNFTQPRKDEEAFKAYIQKQKTFIENNQLSPNTSFYDTIYCTMSRYNFRSRPLTMKTLEEINLHKAFEIYKNRFADAGDFTFYFVGNIDAAALKQLTETYLASLPALNRNEKWKDLNIIPPTGKTVKTVKRGIEPKSSVQLQFYDDLPYTRHNRYMLNALNQLVSIKLRESMREEKGGVYGVGASGYLTHYPKEKYTISVNFGCSPENKDMLIKTVLEEIEKIKKEGCNNEDLVKIKELMRREREVALKENNFWLQTISQYDYDGENINEMNDFYPFLDKLDSEALKNACKQFFNMNNYAEFVLLPEK